MHEHGGAERARSGVAVRGQWLALWMAGLLALLPGSALAAASACQPALAAHAWRPFVLLAGQPAGGPAAVDFLEQTLAVQQRALMHTALGPKVADLKGRFYHSLRNFDLADLYDMLPGRSTPPWRSITLQGVPTASQYRVSQVPAASMDVAPSPYGAMNSQFRMRPVQHKGGPFGDRYALKARARLDSGPLRWPAVLDALRAGLANVAVPAPIIVAPERLAAVQATSKYLSDYDARVLAQFAAAFPATFKWFSGIGHVANLSLTGDGATAGPYHLYVAIQLDDKALEALYPNVEEYLKRLGDFVNGTFDVESGEGRWMNVHFDTARRRLAMDLWVEQGLPIPSRNGQPSHRAPPAAIPDSLSWQTHANLHFKALGVSVGIEDWQGDWIYHRTAGGMKIDGAFHRQPQVRVTGKALHIIPTDWLKALSPISIEDAVNGFMQVLAGSNDGRGAEVHAALSAPSAGGADGSVSAAASGTALDNVFVRLGMAMVSHRVLPDEDQAEGLRRIINDGLTAYGKDLHRMAKLTGGKLEVPVAAACAAR